MAIKRFYATKDTTITNAYKSNLTTRGTGSNMGESDVLELFSIYAQASTSSHERSRALINFDMDAVSNARSSGSIPASGSVEFYLRMYNARHVSTLPRKYWIDILPMSASWEEGYGHDMEEYSDKGAANWIDATSTSAKATLADAIDISGHANGDKFTMQVPVVAGGDNVLYTFLIDTTTACDADTGANTFGISSQKVSDDGDLRDTIVDAINGVVNAKYKYGNADTHEGSSLAAGTIGLTAAAGTGAYTITLTLDAAGSAGNVSEVLSAVTNFAEGDKLVVTAFTGGDGPWATEGGDFMVGSSWYPTASAYFERGYEDLNVKISHIVERWLKNDTYFPNYGLGIKLSGTYETGSTRSYYTKKFFARGTEYFFKQPCIEARWDSSVKDQRGSTFYSSSLASGPDNLNTIYLYNYVRGRLKNIPTLGPARDGRGALNVQIYSGNLENTRPVGSAIELVVDNKNVNAGVGSRINTVITGGFVSTGIYSASFAVTASKIGPALTHIFDVWYTGSKAKSAEQAGGTRNYFTGVIEPKRLETSMINPTPSYTTKITNLKPSYHPDENIKLRLYIRDKNWNPNIYTVANRELQTETIENAYYKVVREADDLVAIPYGTGSRRVDVSNKAHLDDPKFTRLSYDVSGNYFDLNMSLMEPGYMYKIKFMYDVGDSLREQKESFKFRVDKHDSE